MQQIMCRSGASDAFRAEAHRWALHWRRRAPGDHPRLITENENLCIFLLRTIP
jgi:hypothetical protein